MPEDSCIDVWMQRYLEGTLDGEDAAQLLAAVRSRPDLGHALLDHLALDEMLREVSAPRRRVPETVAVIPAAARRFSMSMVAGVAALAACVTLTFTWIWFGGSSGSGTEPTTSAVAVLTRLVNAEWEPSSPQPATNALLSPGTLRLKSGVAQIEFFEGARVVLEGPAELKLVSVDEAYCSRGRLSAHVPSEARGFKIGTPKGMIVDLGTEFGLAIDGNNAQVHVFKGEVELHQGGAMQSLKQGQGVAFSDPGAPRALKADAADFLSVDDLESRTAASQRAMRDLWLRRSREWNDDPALRLRFDFEDGEGVRALRNRALRSPVAPDGSLVGCAWTQGRWSGKTALAFRSAGDRVRLSLPGEFASMTLAAWVRVDGLDRQFNSLFMSQGWANAATHWQITHDGRIRFGVASDGSSRNADFDSPVVVTPERFGQWLHLALVYDAGTAEVRHYVDGERVSSRPVQHVHPLRPGIAELGNWNDPNRRDRTPIRNLSGAMDEFAVYDRALDDDGVRSLAR